MRHYAFQDLSVGMAETFQVTVTQENQELFLKLSGDINPLHTDQAYALQEGYRDCLVYGMCTASFYSTLVGVYLPGEACLFHECNMSWPRPVYIGDKLTVTGRVTELDERFHQVKIKAFITNQNGEKVSRATLVVGVRK